MGNGEAEAKAFGANGLFGDAKMEGERKLLAVIFDCFGVLVTELGDTWVRRHSFSENRVKDWKKIARAGDLGELSENELYRLSGRMVDNDAGGLEAEWDSLVVLNEEVLNTVKLVRAAGYKVAVLSNATRMVRKYLAKFGIEDDFDGVFISSEMRLVKPDVRIYEMAAKNLGVRACDCLMVDDKEKCVVGARESGMLGLQYYDGMDLPSALKRLGVKF